jgi:hypothetical protein
LPVNEGRQHLFSEYSSYFEVASRLLEKLCTHNGKNTKQVKAKTKT